MNSKIVQFAERRTVLLGRVAIQREKLAEAISPFQGALNLADKGLQALKNLAKHPLLVAGVVTIVVAIRPKRWLFSLEKAWMVWRLILAARRKIE